ncbi:MAG: glucose 1-dehydrogenase [Cyclobacteriaceae bacterium]
MNPEKIFSLTDKTAIVTGASKGIGLAIAQLYAHYGANVVVSSRKQEAVDEVAKELTDKGLKATGIACHMGDGDQITQLVDRTVETYGGVDIIVNNAAVNPIFGGIEESNDDAFDKIMNVNVRGPLQLCKVAFPHLRKNGGSVINISSIEGITPGQGLGLYSVSKSALIQLTKVLAREWGTHHIRANVICPGLVKTKFSEALTSNDKILKLVMMKQALPTVAEPEDMAGLALFLASDASAFCTGASYIADGGYTI